MTDTKKPRGPDGRYLPEGPAKAGRARKKKTNASAKKKADASARAESAGAAPIKIAPRKRIKAVLTMLLDETQSGATRIAAAKALLEQLDKQDEKHDSTQSGLAERKAAIAEITALLEKLAACAHCRAACAPLLD